MTTSPPPHDHSLPSPPAPPRSCAPLKIVIVYDDTPASLRATRALADFGRDLGPGARLLPSPWHFDQLMSLPGRCRAIADVTDATLIILSVSQPKSIPEAINRWFETCLKRKRGQAATVLALFGSDEGWTVSLEGATATARSAPAHIARTPRPTVRQNARPAFRFPFVRLSAQPAGLPC